MSRNRKNRKKKNGKMTEHLKKIGFTNRLAVYMLLFLFFGLVGGFYLAVISIHNEYMGSLLCWTVVFTPIGTATSLAISRVVDKSKAENTAGGIKFETAMIKETAEQQEPFLEEEINEVPVDVYEDNIDSPEI